jgi:hypothetical protein
VCGEVVRIINRNSQLLENSKNRQEGNIYRISIILYHFTMIPNFSYHNERACLKTSRDVMYIPVRAAVVRLKRFASLSY